MTATLTKQYNIRVRDGLFAVDVLSEDAYRGLHLFTHAAHGDSPLVTVSEFSTGMQIAAHDTEAQALAEAHRRLDQHAPEQLQEMLGRSIQRFGNAANQEPEEA